MSNSPLVNFHFQVEWGGTRIGFTEVTGLDLEYEVIEYRDGAEPGFSTTKIPGLKKYPNIVFKRGVYKGDNEFFEWWNSVRFSDFRRDITISLLNEAHEPTVVWKAIKAWPVKLQSSPLHATNSEVLIESMEVAHDGLVIENK